MWVRRRRRRSLPRRRSACARATGRIGADRHVVVQPMSGRIRIAGGDRWPPRSASPGSSAATVTCRSITSLAARPGTDGRADVVDGERQRPERRPEAAPRSRRIRPASAPGSRRSRCAPCAAPGCPSKRKGPPRSGTAPIVVTAVVLGGDPVDPRPCPSSVKTLSGVNLALEAPGRLRPRLETMRHWITSFQLLNRDRQYGPLRRVAQRKRPNIVHLAGDCGFTAPMRGGVDSSARGGNHRVRCCRTHRPGGRSGPCPPTPFEEAAACPVWKT